MGQSPSSCLGSAGVAVNQPRHPYKSSKSSSNRQQNSVQFGGKDGQSSHGIDESPTQSAVPTLPSNIDGPPTPELYADPPPASAVPPNQPILGGISRRSRSRGEDFGQQQASGEAVKDKSRRRLLSYVRDRRSSNSADTCADSSVHRRTEDDKFSGSGSSGVGVLKFLSATAEDGDPAPFLPEDAPVHTKEYDEETQISSATKRNFSPRMNRRMTRHDTKPSMVVRVPAKTQLFYSDPLVLETHGLDVTDEATVAGTQIYAARVASVADDQSTLEDGDEIPNTSSSPLRSEDSMSSSPSSPQSLTNDDETSLLLLPNSADAATISTRGSKHRRFRLFGRSKDKPMHSDDDFICNRTYYGGHCNPHPNSQCMAALSRKMETPPRYRETYIPTYPKGCASILFTREAVRNNAADPVSDIVCVSEEHKIFVADIGLTDRDCQSIISVAEHCSRGTWAAYTYAKQTLGCREFDDLASVCVGPVMTATATIMETFEEPYVDDEEEVSMEDGSDLESEDGSAIVLGKNGEDNATAVEEPPPMEEMRPDSAPEARPRYKRQLVLDDREPHLVKYDLTRKERQKLDTHTDKSEWTFLISLSEGCGADYSGGGTFFECIDSTVHLSRGQTLIFPGKLRHRGQKITAGRRFLLVGFLVDKNEDSKKMKTSSQNLQSRPMQTASS